MIHGSIDTIGPDDPEWDTISAFTGKPLPQDAKEANDRRRIKNQASLDANPGGRRRFRINRMIASGGTKKQPKIGPRVFIVDGTAGAFVTRPKGDTDSMPSCLAVGHATTQVNDVTGAAWDALAAG